MAASVTPKCPGCTKLKKEKRLILAELNKANDQIVSLEDVIFELDKRIEKTKLSSLSTSQVHDVGVSVCCSL